MDKYRKVIKPREAAVQEETEIRVTSSGSVSAYISRAAKLFNEMEKNSLNITASGNALTKAVTAAEVIKRRFRGLHQITKIVNEEVEDEYEPLEEGLDKVTQTRTICCLNIQLSKDALDENALGYQPPIDEALVKEVDPEELLKPRGRSRSSSPSRKGKGKGKKGKGKGKKSKGKGKGATDTESASPRSRGRSSSPSKGKGKGKGKDSENGKGKGKGKGKDKGKGKGKNDWSWSSGAKSWSDDWYESSSRYNDRNGYGYNDNYGSRGDDYYGSYSRGGYSGKYGSGGDYYGSSSYGGKGGKSGKGRKGY